MHGASARLRQAAALLRERAGGTTPPPWTHEADEHGDHRVGDTARTAWVAYTGEDDDGPEARADAAYIATMHPGVALLLADLLEGEIYEAEYEAYEGRTYDHPALALADALLTPDTKETP